MEASSEQGHITKSLDPHSAVCQSQWGGGYLINVPPKSNLNDKICCFFVAQHCVVVQQNLIFGLWVKGTTHTVTVCPVVMSLDRHLGYITKPLLVSTQTVIKQGSHSLTI